MGDVIGNSGKKKASAATEAFFHFLTQLPQAFIQRLLLV